MMQTAMNESTLNCGRARGFSMVEMLVALVVLGVGMLGIASLYVVTLRASGSAISRMQAVNLATDIGDRIRANRTAREAYEGAAADNSCVDTDDCSPDAMAANDLFLWQQQIAETLPGTPTGTVDVSGATNTRTYTITLTWLEAGDSGADNRQSYVMRMQI